MRWMGLWMLLLATPAAAQPVVGTWSGGYVCAQGETALELSVEALSETQVRALFHFSAHSTNPFVPEGCFAMLGNYVPASRHVDLSAQAWIDQPFGYVMVDLSGNVGSDGTEFRGTVIGPACSTFALHRTGDMPTLVPTTCRPRPAVSAMAK